MTAVSGEGSPADFEALVAEVYRPVLRYLLRRTDPATADDVLGDVLLVLWRRYADVPAAPLPFCFGVARGCLANRRRGDERQRRLTDRLAVEARVSDHPPATGGTVNACGFSGPATAELEQVYGEAFPG